MPERQAFPPRDTPASRSPELTDAADNTGYAAAYQVANTMVTGHALGPGQVACPLSSTCSAGRRDVT